MTSEELAFVAFEGDAVDYTHAVLIETSGGWHVEIEDLPADCCPFTEGACRITLDAWDGTRYSGEVVVSYRRDDSSYLMLSGSGELERTSRVDPSSQDVEASV